MKHLKSLTYLALSLMILSACSKSDDPDPEPIPPTPTDTVLTSTITSNRTLTADKKWILKGYVYVPNGVTLTIEAGTTILGDADNKGALCIERGGKIIAEGTADKPIVFTSSKAAGSRAPGDWGGVVILGRARTNRSSTPVIEGGLDRPYGGTDDADNSGILKYVRIEYAGIAAFANSEINALTLGGVGTGTVIDYVQTIYANDDAYELFGGKVNAKHLIAAYTADDDFDFDFGYTGKIQYAVSLRDPAFVDGGDAGNGIECDNDGSGTSALPYTRPVLSNFTFVGPNNAAGTLPNHNFTNRFRRASRFALGNSVLMGYMDAGLSLESDSTGQAFANGLSVFSNNLVHAIANPYWIPSSSGTPTIKPEILTIAQMTLVAVASGSVVYPAAADIKLKTPFNLTAPDFTPDAGSPALAGAVYTADFADAFFTSGTYRGAIGTTNWLSGWSRFTAVGN